jgi:hypothetical protein
MQLLMFDKNSTADLTKDLCSMLCQMRNGGMWRVEPSSGTVEPESFLDLVVTACLDDSLA